MEMTTAQNTRIEFQVAPDKNGQCVQHGPWAEFYPNGKLRLKTNYVYGNAVGKWDQWFQSGQKNRSGTFDKSGNETGYWITYYKNGLLQLAGHYHNGKQSGQWKVWSPIGRLLSVTQWLDGKLHGQARNYHPNGTKSIEGLMVDGSKRGVWKWWDSQGNLIKTEDFK